MKNFTNNFKQFTSRLSARWFIMALMLLLGTGSIWGAQKALYLNAGGSSLWDQGGAKFVAYVWADDVSATWHEATKVGSYYQVMVSDKVTKVIWLRKDPSGYVYNNWTCWNRVGDVTGMDTNNLTTVNGWNESSFKTSYYDDISTYTVSGTDNAVKLSDSDKWVTYTLYKDGTAVSSSAKTGTGSALSWTVTDGGEYTVKGTNTYKTEDMSGSYTYSSCTPKNPTFVHTNSSYNEISTPTYYLGDKAYFKSTINCCLTGNWSKTGTGTYKTLTGSIPNFYLTLSSVGSFTLTNAATDGCDGSTSPSISFTTQALPNPTAQSASISGTTASLSWTKNATYTTVMVVRYAKGATVTAPTQGTSYAVNGTIGTGKVVYKGTGTSYTNTGLTAGSSYDYYFYTVNNNYYSAGVTATAEACTSPNVQISNLSSTTLCTGGSLTFNYTAAAGAKVTFKMGTNPNDFTVTGGGSNSGTVTIKYNSSTSINGNAIKYDVSGTGICALSDQSTGTTIKCGPKPSIAATSSTPFSFCPGDAAVTLSVTAGQGTYSWAKNGDVIAGKTTNSIEVSDAGTYTVFVVGTGGCESNTVTFTVNGNGGPVIKSTDASFNKNNFADFAALYVTDCSGKEVDGYQWYKDGNEYESKCEYTTKDGVVTGDAGKTNNIRPNAAGDYTCKATYKDGTSATSAAFTVTATNGTTYADFKSNLPVIMVNTGTKDFPTCPVENETASKNADKMKKKRSVDVKILSEGKIVYDRKARMAYRGSSSLNFQKKSYAFCPGDANCGDEDETPDYVKTAKLNMLGIGEATDKDWVLYAAAADPSMLRNRMVFETYQAMRPGEWGVHSRYVELIINGEYKGVYLMMDKITQNKKRVNVEWDVKDETKRGFILKFDKTDVADRSKDYPDGDEKTFLSKYSGKHDIGTYDATNDQAFEIEYPEKGDIEDKGGNWYDVINFIQGMINNFETALSAGEYQKVQQIIDYESWADWFILSEYTKNVDAFRASCMFVYDGTKLKATPLWDQELSFNNQSVHANRYKDDQNNKGCENVTGLLIKNDRVYSDSFAAPFWFTGKLAGGKGTEKAAAKTFTGALLNDPCFVQMVKNRWEAHKEGALSNASLTALITNYEKELTSAVRDREANFWNGKSRNTLSCSWDSNTTGYYDDTYADAKADITAWISDAAASGSTGRRAGLNTAISALEGTGLDIAIKPASIQTTPWVPVVIQVQNETGYEYTLTYTDGELDKQPNIIIEKSGDTYKYHIPRPAAWPAGDEQVAGERTDINYGIKATLQVGEGNNQCGSSTELPSATATIVLQDEPNDSEKCK